MCAGCAELPVKYVPQTMGSLGNGEPVNGLEVRIRPQSEHITMGKPIVFSVTIENTGTKGFWVPRKPYVLFVWTYSDGQRDNFVQELPEYRHFNKETALWLGPGKKMSSQTMIKTHYFPKPGITEFQAVYHAERNTNPDLIPFWHGQAASNAYGIMVEAPAGIPSRRRFLGSRRLSSTPLAPGA